MTNIDYAVIIRTIGKAGIKYQALLTSISKLQPQPKEVIVVLPHGYNPPVETLGYEKIVYSNKGMVSQRVCGIRHTTCKYALICDDDVTFECDFVKKLYKPLYDNKCKISSGPLLSFLPERGAKTFIGALMAASGPTFFHKNRYVSIMRSTGFTFNRNINVINNTLYQSQSLPGTCFFADVDALLKLRFDDECWIDSNGYSAYEDQVMFYKAWLNNYNPLIVSDAIYEHLDARTSVQNNKPEVTFSTTLNRRLFWHRFIYSQEKNHILKLWSIICFTYRNAWLYMWSFIGFLRKRNSFKELQIINNANKQYKEYIKSDAYQSLPSILVK